MSELADPAEVLVTYLGRARAALRWNVEGLGERALRVPRTPTGTSLQGIVLHGATIEIGYCGPTFGRAWPDPSHPLVIADDASPGSPPGGRPRGVPRPAHGDRRALRGLIPVRDDARRFLDLVRYVWPEH